MLFIGIRGEGKVLFFAQGNRPKFRGAGVGKMKYIECNHCQKRYPSNRKFEEAALRRKVRCTDCGESFPIVIYEVQPEQETSSDPEPFYFS